MKYILKIIKNDVEVIRVGTGSLRRFLKIIRTINWQHGPIKVYLRISYGKHEDSYGEMSDFWNDGWYETEEDLMLAFDAFREEG